MKKIAVVFWSSTKNTEQMASFVKDGVEAAGGSAALLTASEFNSSMMGDFDAIAFGCPSMGAETLEESEFQPMFDDCVGSFSGKSIALFGSYGWGDGEWMRNWEEECKGAGANLVADFVICNDAPDDVAAAACKSLGDALAK